MKCLVLLFIVASAIAGNPKLIPGMGIHWIPLEPSGVNTEFRWNEAFVHCNFKGGHLAVINSEAEAHIVAKLMSEHGVLQAHVGFTDAISEGIYLTLDDHTLKEAGYEVWANRFPIGGKSSNCGSIDAQGQLVDIDCYKILPLVCEADIVSEMNPKKSSYILHKEKLTWGEALEKCHAQGATLAVMNSDEEAAYVTKRVMKRVDSVHVGIQDQYSEASYYTVDGVTVEKSGYNKWVPQQPYKTFSLNYVAMNKEGLYELEDGINKLPFVCEKRH